MTSPVLDTTCAVLRRVMNRATFQPVMPGWWEVRRVSLEPWLGYVTCGVGNTPEAALLDARRRGNWNGLHDEEARALRAVVLLDAVLAGGV